MRIVRFSVRTAHGHFALFGTVAALACASLVAKPASAAVSDVAVGHNFSCAVVGALGSSGPVKCWGRNDWGQLGADYPWQHSGPIAVSGLTGVRQLAVGEAHACALLSNSTVKCWGFNGYGNVGNSSASRTAPKLVPTLVSGLSKVAAIAAGGNHTCAISGSTSAVMCWGSNIYGELGNGSKSQYSVKPVTATGISRAKSIAVGENHSCVLITGGQVRCWGLDATSQLGDGVNASTDVANPTVRRTSVLVKGLTTATAIAAGSATTCALLATNSVRCWGSNGASQIGAGPEAPAVVKTPTQVGPGLLPAAKGIAMGAGHACAVIKVGGVWCWGDGTSGQTGIGQTIVSWLPDQLLRMGDLPMGTPTKMALGKDHTCAIIGTSLYCWGGNTDGQLGIGSTAFQAIAKLVPTL